MRVAIEHQPWKREFGVTVFQRLAGGGARVWKTLTAETVDIGVETAYRSDEPTLQLTHEQLVDLHGSLTKELRRLGILPEEPSFELLAEKDEARKRAESLTRYVVDKLAVALGKAMKERVVARCHNEEDEPQEVTAT